MNIFYIDVVDVKINLNIKCMRRNFLVRIVNNIIK